MNTLQLARQVEQEVIEIRRHLHEHPEVSMKEKNTMAFITGKLQEFGIGYEIVPDGGIIGTINGASQGKTLILRADLDALPVQEAETNLSKRKKVISKTDGVAHMCG